MGVAAPYTNARDLQSLLMGFPIVEQQQIARQWAQVNDRIIDMFGQFA